MLALTLSILLVARSEVHPGWPAPDERIECGPLTFEVYVSRTAHRFHVVDQISAWDNACHGQYRENMSLSARDEAVLARYAGMRRKRRWGAGLEQTFYTPLEVDAAIRAGRGSGYVTLPEARIVRETMEHFAPEADALLAEKRGLLLAAFDRLDRDRFARAAEQLARFTGVEALTVPVFPIASPAPGGGGMDGGRLRWEIHSEGDLSFSVLLHEVTHGFFQKRDDLLRATVERTPGLDMTLLGEGFAYAVAPGMYPDTDFDQLGRLVSSDLKQGRGWGGTTYEHQRMFALALRPLLREAFDDGVALELFLPRARDVFLALEEVNAEPPVPTLFAAGPMRDEVKARLIESKYRLSMYRFNHDPRSYDEYLPKANRGDLLVLLVAGDDAERIPRSHAALSPVAPAAIEKRLAAGGTIAQDYTNRDGLRIVLLAAPTARELRALVRSTPLLEP